MRRWLTALPLLLAACGCASSGSDAGTSAATSSPPPPPAGSSAAPAPAGLRLAPVLTGLEGPVDVVFAPSDPSHMVVVQQGGDAVVFEDGHQLSRPLLDLRGKVSTGSEQGLLGLAFAPTFPDDPRIVVDYTDPSGDTNVVSYRVSDWRADPSSAKRLLFVDQPYSNHNGGDVVFGPDGRLYIGMGDGGSAGDPGNRAQNPDVLLGKMLRMDDRPPAAADLRAGPAQPLAVLLRPADRRPVDRRRRAGGVGGDRPPAGGRAAGHELRLEPVRGQPRVQRDLACRAAVHEPGGRVQPRARVLGDRRVRVPRPVDPRARRALRVRRLLQRPAVVARPGREAAAAGARGARADVVRRGSGRPAVRRVAGREGPPVRSAG